VDQPTWVFLKSLAPLLAGCMFELHDRARAEMRAVLMILAVFKRTCKHSIAFVDQRRLAMLAAITKVSRCSCQTY
jgi:hypothetical protein